jgi:AraC-like DNA-binding protein
MARAPYLFPVGSCFGADNLVLHARATHHQVENFAGPLSIKTVVAGQVEWTINGRKLLVDPSSFLVLPAGEKYSMNIAAAKPVETCCIFFSSGFVEQLAADMTSPLERALSSPQQSAPLLPYLSALHADRENTIVQRAQNLARCCASALAPSGLEEEFLSLGADLLNLYKSIRDQIARLPSARSSTRHELYRRLLIGRDYLHSQGDGPISLATVSRAAGLSLFHFHRGFTDAFQQTPHAYLTKLRLERARHLMEAGSPVLHACLDVGFSSPSAFSRLFRLHYGKSPSAIRRKLARSGKNLS